MNLDRIEQRLADALESLPVIDAHEHLWPEKRRLARTVDFYLLFCQYSRLDLRAAGMPPDDIVRCREDQEMPVEEKWAKFRPFYPMIKHGAFARPARIWLKDVLGHDDLTDRNYKDVSAALQENNRPGLYDRVLRRMCRIETSLVVAKDFGHEEYDGKRLRPLWRAITYTTDEFMGPYLAKCPPRKRPRLADYLDWMEADFEAARRIGTFGIKAICWPGTEEKPDLRKADKIFQTLRVRGGMRPMTRAESATVTSAIYDRAFDLARRHNLTVAVHSGVWGDFRDSQPAHLIPVAMRYRDVAFDLFHLGAPYYNEAVMIGKMFPNVSLNLCWNSVMSPEVTARALDDCLDMVPVNRVILFGADYNMPVEKVYGHLKMAKANAARALAQRIRQGLMDHDEAMRVAKLWFHDNAAAIYRLR